MVKKKRTKLYKRTERAHPMWQREMMTETTEIIPEIWICLLQRWLLVQTQLNEWKDRDSAAWTRSVPAFSSLNAGCSTVSQCKGWRWTWSCVRAPWRHNTPCLQKTQWLCLWLILPTLLSSFCSLQSTPLSLALPVNPWLIIPLLCVRVFAFMCVCVYITFSASIFKKVDQLSHQ